MESPKLEDLIAEVERLRQENIRLRTIMLAAHDEITEFWAAHCDPEGYGPQSLVRHLRDGTGYYPGMLDRLKEVKDEP